MDAFVWNYDQSASISESTISFILTRSNSFAGQPPQFRQQAPQQQMMMQQQQQQQQGQLIRQQVPGNQVMQQPGQQQPPGIGDDVSLFDLLK